jgi:hypothetical protein
MASSLLRTSAVPDSARGAVAIAALDELVADADRPAVDAQLAVVTSAPGPALLVWGADATCLAYNRHYRSVAGLKTSALGKPLFKAQPELERAWKPKLDLTYAGSAATLDGAAFTGGTEGVGGDQLVGWLLPIAGSRGGGRGVLCLFMDAGPLVEPTRRLVGAVAHDLREPLVGIQVVSERLARLPKPTRERCVEDMERVLELANHMDRLTDEMGAFARRSTAGGARLSPRLGDLGAIVRDTCAKIERDAATNLRAGEPGLSVSEPKVRPIRVSANEVYGLWDDAAIARILTSLVASARQNGEDVVVELQAAREGAVLTIKDDGPGPRGDEAEQLFEPWKRGSAPGAERRRRGVGLGLYLARELVQAHGGKISPERTSGGGFVMKVTLPITNGSPASGPPGSYARTVKGSG